MKKLSLCLSLLLFLCCLSVKGKDSVAVQSLTAEQKIADFEYLYAVLRDNYPFFGVAERKYGVDWLAKHDEYVERVAATADNKDYIAKLNRIINELRDGHLDIFPTVLPEYFEGIYSSAPGYKKWVKMIKRSGRRAAYWSNMFPSKPKMNVDNASQPVISFYSDSMFLGGKVAYMRIASLDMKSLIVDGEKIDRFLSSIGDAVVW